MSTLSLRSVLDSWFRPRAGVAPADEALVRSRLAEAAKAFRSDGEVLSVSLSPTREGAFDEQAPITGTARLSLGGARVDVTFTLTPTGGEVRMPASLERPAVAVFNGTRFLARPLLKTPDAQREEMRRRIDEFVDNTERATATGAVLEARNVLSRPEVDELVALAKGADGALSAGGREELEQLVYRSAFNESARDGYATEAERAAASRAIEGRPHFALTRGAVVSLFGALGLGNPYQAYFAAHPEVG